MTAVSYLEFRALPGAPFWARRQTRAALQEWKFRREEIETAELMVSELVTNAVKFIGPRPAHASDRELACAELISLTLRCLSDRLIIEVSDPDPRPPLLTEPAADAESGRGLMLVQILSKEWNHYPCPTGGKVVYCVLATAPGT